MSHGITATDGMFTVRQAAWHDLGVVFEDYPTREQAQSIAHPWEPLREDIFRNVPVMIEQEDGTSLPLLEWDEDRQENRVVTEQKLVAGFYANVRSDNGFELGVVSDKYVTVSNTELWDIAEAIEQSGGDVMYETGGSLRGGAQVWALVRLQEPLVIKGDPRGETIPYFALQNSHDGSGSFRGQATMTRIVCMNTSHVADMDAKARGTEFMFRHTKSVKDRILQAQEALGGWRQSIEDWTLQQEELIQLKVTDKGVLSFLEHFIPMPPTNLVSEKVIANVEAERGKWLAGYRSITGDGIDKTAYGLVQASTEYANWARKAHTAESRFRRTFLSRDNIVSSAVPMAIEASKVDGSKTLQLV